MKPAVFRIKSTVNKNVRISLSPNVVMIWECGGEVWIHTIGDGDDNGLRLRHTFEEAHRILDDAINGVSTSIVSMSDVDDDVSKYKCSECERNLSDADIAEYRGEGDGTGCPDMCSDCAEMASVTLW